MTTARWQEPLRLEFAYVLEVHAFDMLDANKEMVSASD